MTATDYAALSQAIADSVPSLSPQLRRAARHVLERPDDVALRSMRGVAADAGVHPSTMIRLARAFDFTSYNDFRATFQKRLRSHPADFLGRARELQMRAGGDSHAIVAEVMDAAVGNLRESFEINGTLRFAGCAKALANAERIFIAGWRSCFCIAHYFHYVYSLFRGNSVLLDASGGTFADRLRGFTGDDVLLAVSFDPYSFEAVKAVEFVRERGGSAVVITDSLVAPVIEAPERTLLIRNESPSFFQSAAPAMAAIEALIAVIVLEAGDDALDAIAESQSQLRHFDAYWNQPQDGRGMQRSFSQ